MRQLLLIDDDDKLGALLKDYLRQFDMSLDSELSPGRGLSALKNGSYELLILDIMLPEMDGFAVCRQIREHRSIYGSIPIIMLTARGDVTDRNCCDLAKGGRSFSSLKEGHLMPSINKVGAGR